MCRLSLSTGSMVDIVQLMKSLRNEMREGKKVEVPWENCDVGTFMLIHQIRTNKWHKLGYEGAIDKACTWREANWQSLTGCRSVEDAQAENEKIKASIDLQVVFETVFGSRGDRVQSQVAKELDLVIRKVDGCDFCNYCRNGTETRTAEEVCQYSLKDPHACRLYEHSTCADAMAKHLKTKPKLSGLKEPILKQHAIRYMNKKGAHRLGSRQEHHGTVRFKSTLHGLGKQTSKGKPMAVDRAGNPKTNSDQAPSHYDVYMGWQLVKSSPLSNTEGSSSSDPLSVPQDDGDYEDDAFIPPTQDQIAAARSGTSQVVQAELRARYPNVPLESNSSGD